MCSPWLLSLDIVCVGSVHVVAVAVGHSSSWLFSYCAGGRHLDTFHSGAITEKSAVDTPTCHSVTTAPISLGGIPGWNFWVMGWYLFSFGRNCLTIFPSGGTNCNSHQLRARV